MREMILCKLGEVVLKGLNRRSFEDKLIGNLRRRTAKCGNFRIYSKQSTIYVEPVNDETDLTAAYAACKQVFGVIAVSRALPCEKDVQAIICTAKDYLAPEFAREGFQGREQACGQNLPAHLHSALPAGRRRAASGVPALRGQRPRPRADGVHRDPRRRGLRPRTRRGGCGRTAHRHGRQRRVAALRRHRLARRVLHDGKARRIARNGPFLPPTPPGARQGKVLELLCHAWCPGG